MARATPPLLKQLNERAVLDAIREGAPISRAEIARRTGISKPTVSLALRVLVESGVVRETAPDPGRPHYGAVFFEPIHELALVLGLDIGARFVRGAISDLDGQVRARQDVELRGTDTPTALATIAELREALLQSAEAPADRLGGAVVGGPGRVHPPPGAVPLATNLPGIEGHRLADELRGPLR